MRKYGYKRPSATLYVRKRRTARNKQPSFFFKFICLSVLLGGVGAGLFFGGRAAYRAFAQAEFTNWHVKAVAVSGVSDALEKEIRTRTDTLLGKTFSGTQASNLEQTLSQQLPMLKSVSVSRGFFSGKLKIAVRARKAVARFVLPDGSYKYLDDSGTVYADPAGPKDILQIELKGDIPTQLPTHFVSEVQTILKIGKKLPAAAFQITVPQQTITMVLTDKSVLHLGAAEQLKEKISRAEQILQHARQAYDAPFRVDFTYFNQGKVFLTHSVH